MEKAHVTPKDFFFWAGAIISLYGSIASFLVLLFEYINRLLPDVAMGYGYDVYSNGIRFAMASLIVLAPITVLLFSLIRRDIKHEPAKANAWVRRFALVLTLFLAGAMLAIDLITLITTFLGGELTLRFGFKVLVVLLVGALVFMHFLADIKGYWIAFPKRARIVGVAVGILAIATVVAGFFVIGSPREMRLMRLDDTRVSDLQNIQWQIVNYWQQKEALPATLEDLADPLSEMSIPSDPETGTRYEYERTGTRSFTLCAVFGRESLNTDESQARFKPDGESWAHDEGRTCFDRTIDPERYPPYAKPVR